MMFATLVFTQITKRRRTMLTAHQIDKYQKRLHEMRADLDSHVPSLRDEAYRGAGGDGSGDLSKVPIHQADIADQESEAVVNLQLAAMEASRRQEVDEALIRLEEGRFGICELCNHEISRERLEAIPYSRLCIKCAEQNQ
jgi:RNA polymerase-binding transcription factor DksA